MYTNAFSGLITRETVAPLVHAKDQFFVFLEWLGPYSATFSLLLIVGIVYCFLRIEQIVHATRHEDVSHGDGHGEESSAHVDNPSEKRWQRVMTYLNSDRESDWRLAVLEADVLLDEMLTQMGYHGDSIGEKLRSVEKSDFLTVEFAGEAHGVRNRIAHEGVAFTLTEREAKRVIKMYEDVFKEFKYLE